MIKNKKAIVLSAIMSVLSFGAIVYTSCNKDHCNKMNCQNGGTCSSGQCSCPAGYSGTYCEVKSQSTVHFQNRTFTPMTMYLNGNTYTVDTGTHLTLTGNYGDTVKGSAFVKGAYGLTYSWDTVMYVFPRIGDYTVNMDVPTTYFFLKVTNINDTATIRKVYVNLGTPQETLDIVLVPNDHQPHYIGYYQASDTTVVKLQSTPSTWIYNSLALPSQLNQFYNAIVN